MRIPKIYVVKPSVGTIDKVAAYRYTTEEGVLTFWDGDEPIKSYGLGEWRFVRLDKRPGAAPPV